MFVWCGVLIKSIEDQFHRPKEMQLKMSDNTNGKMGAKKMCLRVPTSKYYTEEKIRK